MLWLYFISSLSFFPKTLTESHEVATHQQRLRQELFHAMHFADFFPDCRPAKEILLQLSADTYARVPQLGVQSLPLRPRKGASPGEPRCSRRLLPCLQRRALSSLLLALLPGARGSFEAAGRPVRGCQLLHSAAEDRRRRRAVPAGKQRCSARGPDTGTGDVLPQLGATPGFTEAARHGCAHSHAQETVI